ncbi:ferric reductase [Aspergillus cavernicola]|uniref:Ferric reductase n=1 Tax=Aspergillus cavernicola TaxID=176166 RepID=A0ABR4IU14_9EURO
MHFPRWLATGWLFLSLVQQVQSEHGLVGYGISMYNPACAFACRAAITNPLNCSMDAGQDMDMDTDASWMVEEAPTPDCYATNDPFLQTLAYCMYDRCLTEANSTLQKYWETNVAGTESDVPSPKESYEEALKSIQSVPGIITDSSTVLNSAGRLSDEVYALNYKKLTVFEKIIRSNERYALVLLLTGAIIPIGLSLARFLPVSTVWKAQFEAYFITPPLIGSRHSVPVFGMFNMLTRGQALFTAYLIAINVILCAVGFESARPSTSTSSEIAGYIANRAGTLALANIPLLVLYASRNNVLLRISDWSHTTFMVVHRWIALLCIIEASLHAAIHLHASVAEGEYLSESKRTFWYCGIIAVLSMVIMLPASILPIRRKFYELFLAWHIFFFLVAMTAAFLHIYFRFSFSSGNENWIYVALAIWGFDRIFRILRLSRHGIRTAHVSIVDDDYIKVEIPGVSARGHVYLYFPTLTWRVWENHPFSVLTDVCYMDPIGTVLTLSEKGKESDSTFDVSGDGIIEAMHLEPPQQAKTHCHNSLLLYMRTHTGITNHLRATHSLRVLIESAYHPPSLTALEPSYSPNIIAIAGGVGITGLTPLLLSHCGWHKLFWAVRSSPLVESVRVSLGEDRFSALNPVIFQDERMDLPRLIADEVEKCLGAPVAVVVSGPPRMADEVRVVVSNLMQRNPAAAVTFVEESFGW